MGIEKYNFEKFTGYNSKVSRKISITKSFSFGIPPAFFQEHNLEKFSHVLLFFDPNAKAIAFNFVENDNEGGFKLIHYGSGAKRGASFVARSFFNTYKIDPSEYKGRYDVQEGQKEGVGTIFCIEIGKNKQEQITPATELQ